MNKRLIVGIAAAVVVTAGSVWLLLASPRSTTNSDDTAIAVTSGTITYTDDGFSPAKLKIKAGSTLLVTNQSSSSLEFSSGNHPDHMADPELNMPEIKPGQDETLKLTRAGTWMYHNHLSASDTGTLIVE
jgi:plastocyanin